MLFFLRTSSDTPRTFTQTGLLDTHEKRRGLTIIEVVIYLGLFSILAVFAVNFMIQIVGAYRIARGERDVSSNARLIGETIENTVREAREVYAPTSRFNSALGQLSVITASGATAEHTTAYVDFWIDGERLWMRHEGQMATQISAASVRVTTFYLERIIQAYGREAVKMTLGVSPGGARPEGITSTTLHLTAELRGGY
ncbi:MAG: type II secretion system protein [Candidatus Sungbacteria bacterium]|nr:type II secretion system protein [Candidatus Sungbacteria bacterium]